MTTELAYSELPVSRTQHQGVAKHTGIAHIFCGRPATAILYIGRCEEPGMIGIVIIAIGFASAEPVLCVAKTTQGAPATGDPNKLYASSLKAIQTKQPQKAVPFLERCVRVQPDSARCHRLLGIAFAQSKPPKAERAKACYERYLEIGSVCPLSTLRCRPSSKNRNG